MHKLAERIDANDATRLNNKDAFESFGYSVPSTRAS